MTTTFNYCKDTYTVRTGTKVKTKKKKKAKHPICQQLKLREMNIVKFKFYKTQEYSTLKFTTLKV